jgi:hypothetical protein
MSAEFIEDVQNIQVIAANGLSDVVRIAKYVIDCHYNGQSLRNMYDVELGEPDPNNFTDFASLTKEQVLSWVRASIGEAELAERKSAMVTMIDQMIAAQEDKPRTVSVPW